MSQMLKEKRATRGTRMNDLVGEAADQDEAFWGADVWNEEDDESFSEQDDEPDVFDSDFNDTEDDNDEDEDSQEESAARKIQKNERKGTNKYKEPGGGALKRKQQPQVKREDGVDDDDDDDGDNKIAAVAVARKPSYVSKRARVDPALGGGSLDQSLLSSSRAVRQSTNAKTQETEAHHKRLAKMKSKVRFRPPIKHQFTQKELLLDALDTEAHNQKWVEAQKLIDFERATGEKVHKQQSDNMQYIRFTSRRGTYNTVTFSNVECIPNILIDNEQPKKPNNICVITGRPAKYRDPLTGFPYATLEAFRTLRKKYGGQTQPTSSTKYGGKTASSVSKYGGKVPSTASSFNSYNNNSSSSSGIRRQSSVAAGSSRIGVTSLSSASLTASAY